jgi:hypothetical protein
MAFHRLSKVRNVYEISKYSRAECELGQGQLGNRPCTERRVVNKKTPFGMRGDAATHVMVADKGYVGVR